MPTDIHNAPHLIIARRISAVWDRVERGAIRGETGRRDLRAIRGSADRLQLEGAQKALVNRMHAACGRFVTKTIRAKRAADAETIRAIYADSVSGCVLESFRTGDFVTVYAD